MYIANTLMRYNHYKEVRAGYVGKPPAVALREANGVEVELERKGVCGYERIRVKFRATFIWEYFV